MEFVDQLFQALKRDNLQQFKDCMATRHCGSLRLGRFPVLSVMYLYNAKRLLRAYEKTFLKHNSWQDIGEPMELSAKFRDVAGKCLRIYVSETVSPMEMLLLLNKDNKVKKLYSLAHVTPPVSQRLADIYYIKWGLKAQVVRNKIVLQRRPKTRAEIVRLVTVVICAALCVAIIVSTPFVVNVFAPFIPDGEGVINVTKWEQIKFGSDKIYGLKNDVTVSQDFFVENVNCELRGNGHTVTVQGDRLFGEVNGSLSNIVFETNGALLVDKVTRSATVDNVTVNATVNAQVDHSTSFFAYDNYGTITNVAVNVTGNLKAVAPSQDTSQDTSTFYCAGIVVNNSYTVIGYNDVDDGTLQNCTVNYNGFTLQGQVYANASFGGVVGHNDGIVDGCVTTGNIFADTFDVAGICAENVYLITNCVNKANLSQTTADTQWSPLVAGVVLTNKYSGTVANCINTGVLAALGTHEVCVGGIAGYSSGRVSGSISAGSIEAKGTSCLVGGLVGYFMGENTEMGLYVGLVDNCIADCVVDVTTVSSQDSHSFVGGIVGVAQQWEVNDLHTGELIYINGYLSHCYFTGKLQTTGNTYLGGVVGALGANAYLAVSSLELFHGNVYTDDCGVDSAFGATFTMDNVYETPVADVEAARVSAQDLDNDEIYQQTKSLFTALLPKQL